MDLIDLEYLKLIQKGILSMYNVTFYLFLNGKKSCFCGIDQKENFKNNF